MPRSQRVLKPQLAEVTAHADATALNKVTARAEAPARAETEGVQELRKIAKLSGTCLHADP